MIHFWRNNGVATYSLVLGGILVVVVVAIVLALVLPRNHQNTNNQNNNSSKQGNQQTVDTSSWRTYVNEEYLFTMQYPDTWRVLESELPSGEPVINFYPAGPADRDTPLGLHEDRTYAYIALFPEGRATEAPLGQRVATERLNIPDTTVTEYQLTNGDQPYAYAVTFSEAPQGWGRYGLIWAQAAVPNIEFHCTSAGGQDVPMNQCDELGGTDTITQTGNVDEDSFALVHTALTTLRFVDPENLPQQPSDFINVTSPLPNMDITSPLMVRGEARGPWYFEGSFLVELWDKDDRVIASGNAEAQGPWTTEGFVPFVVTLTFTSPGDERGELVFKRANPSGLPENDMEWSIPVIFQE